MADTKFTQIFIKLLDSKTLTLQIPSHITNPRDFIKHKIETLAQIPPHHQLLILNGQVLRPTTPPKTFTDLAIVTLAVPLRGGKGGFGSLLRGAATKAGQKKTNNFDACRDMSGRRLRHVNNEKKMEEWQAGEEERKMEKLAEDYLKKLAKKTGEIAKRDQKVEKYVEKYREESARCVEEVERSVREASAALSGRKRKALEKLMESNNLVDAKKLKVWVGKRKFGEADSDDSGSDTDDSDTEDEISAVIDNGSQSCSSKDGTNGSVSVSKLDGEQIGGGSSDGGTEEEKDLVAGGSDASLSGSIGKPNEDSPVETSSEMEEVTEKQSGSAEESPASAQIVTDRVPCTSTLREAGYAQLMATDAEVQRDLEGKPASLEEDIPGSSNAVELSQPLNFNDFNSAAEMEVLGMEKLKSELQERGLKCGGTLQERAARLYLLKSTPLEKLPKRLLAKK